MKKDYDPPCTVSEHEKLIRLLMDKNIGLGDLSRRLELDECEMTEFLAGRMPVGPYLSARIKRIMK